MKIHGHANRDIFYTKGHRPREILTITDTAGNIIQKSIRPLMVLFKPQDIVQMIVGATLLAVPLVYTQETWDLGNELPLINVLGLSFISLLFLSLFIYYNIYRHHFKDHAFEFIKRVIGVYFIAFCIVSLFVTLIDKAPWATDAILAIKRVIIISVPASMSAAVADMVR